MAILSGHHQTLYIVSPACREVQNGYWARLTPERWRVVEPCHHVCRLVHEQGTTIHPDIARQLSLHDEMTLREVQKPFLA